MKRAVVDRSPTPARHKVHIDAIPAPKVNSFLAQFRSLQSNLTITPGGDRVNRLQEMPDGCEKTEWRGEVAERLKATVC